MYQLLVTVLSFALIPFLIKKKVKLGTAIFIVTITIGVLSGIGVENLGNTIIGVFLNKYSRDTILTVVMVGILGSLLKNYGILNKIVDLMLKMIPNKKAVMMIIPSLIGILSVPGGAVLSAPFINKMGDEMDIIPARRAVINLVFRHVSMFVFPFTSSLLFVKAAIPEINIYRLILTSSPFVVGMVFLGYYIFMKDKVDDEKRHTEVSPKAIFDLIILTSPIYASVIINLITGFPFFVSMLGSVFITYLLSSKKDFLKTAWQSINYNTIFVITSILILKDIILQLEGMLDIIKSILVMGNGVFSALLIFMAVSFFFGFITGYPTSALAVTIPLLTMMSLGQNELYIYAFFLNAVAFMGYFYSPLHLCQVLTLGEMKVSAGELYKEYKLYFVLQLALVFLITFVLLAVVK
jgi:integral membrane protein (TIGR00529 family)